MRSCAMLLLAVSVLAGPQPGFLLHAAEPTFTVSIDKTAWEKWGLRYPVTYVFEVTGAGDNVEARRQDAGSETWTLLQPKSSADFFNGIECVRLDKPAGRLYVSTGFGKSNSFTIKLSGVQSARFESVARYYDGRRAAYTLSNDNWGCNAWAHPGAPWKGPTHDESDNYQASLHVCRSFHLSLSMAINSRSAGGEAMWQTMQQELDRGDMSWEPAVHGLTHPKNAAGYLIRGYKAEILGCREDILTHLRNIPYGQFIVEHILTYGHKDEMILKTDSGEFLFLRGFNWLDNPLSTDYAPWNAKYGLYGIAGVNTKGYDSLLEKREPKGRYHARDVAELNDAFDKVCQAGGLFHALWHPDRFRNSVIYDPRPGVEGVSGSTLMQHLAHVANRKDIWYVANGWLYCYHYVAEHARVAAK